MSKWRRFWGGFRGQYGPFEMMEAEEMGAWIGVFAGLVGLFLFMLAAVYGLGQALDWLFG